MGKPWNKLKPIKIGTNGNLATLKIRRFFLKKTLRGLFRLRIKWTTELERKVRGRKRARNKVRNRFSKEVRNLAYAHAPKQSSIIIIPSFVEPFCDLFFCLFVCFLSTGFLMFAEYTKLFWTLCVSQVCTVFPACPELTGAWRSLVPAGSRWPGDGLHRSNWKQSFISVLTSN